MAKAGVTKKTDPGLGRTVARLLQESGKRQVDLCEFSHWSRAYVSYICTERRKWPSFDKAKVIADFFSLSLDQLCMTEMTIENTFNLLFPRGTVQITRSRKFLASNKYF